MSLINLNDKFPFGKYKGVVVREIVRTDPNYVEWLALERAKKGDESFSNDVFNSLNPSVTKRIRIVLARDSKKMNEAGAKKLLGVLPKAIEKVVDRTIEREAEDVERAKTYTDFGSW